MKMMLLGGWGMPAGVLEPLRLAMGVRPELCWPLDRPLSELRQRILAEIQPGTLLIGWSLGGALALDLAAQAQDRLTAVVTIGTNPRFLRSPSWVHGYDPKTFQTFAHSLRTDPGATLQQFAALATLGSRYQREELRWLRGQLEPEQLFAPAVLQESLGALETWDLRNALAGLSIPVVHLLGERDALVPAGVAEGLKGLQGKTRVQVIEGMGHLPSFRFSAEVAEQVCQAVIPLIRGWC